MKRSPEHKLDELIDALNQEKQPKQKLNHESAELLAVVRSVKSLRPQTKANRDLGSRVYAAARGQTRRRSVVISAAALVAGLLLFAAFTGWVGYFNQDVVYAMDKAVTQLSNYYGVLEVREKNAAGEEWILRRVELWSDGEKYAMRDGSGILTVNNGDRRWQVRPTEREVSILPLLPDSTRHGFDLRDQADRAKQFPHTVIGQETISGRQVLKLKISPPGGLPYFLWIDTETKLPIQLQTAMQNALQTTYTYVRFEPNTDIDRQIFDYQPPEGYRIVEKDPGQLVATVTEAAVVSGITPLLPEEPPVRILAFKDKIVLDYGDTTITETMARTPFEPDSGSGALGSAGGGPLEVAGQSLRWQQRKVEITIEGSRRIALARQIAADLTLPDTGVNLTDQAKVKVDVDLEIARADQQQVDGGHTPWQLDPLQVSLTFVNLKISPEGIQGEPTVPMSAFKLAANNGVEASVQVDQGPVKTVYLKRLVRQDESGIWSVVGYDPR